jgi:FtsZ-binding cell division protein ZapB
MADDKKKVSALIPVKLLAALEDKGYTNQTETIIKGLECLLTEAKEKITEDIEKTREDADKIGEYRIEAEVLRARTEELERHNGTLKAELERASQDKATLERDKEDLKTTYNNYFLQVQTLINQKAIEAPGNKKAWYKFW